MGKTAVQFPTTWQHVRFQNLTVFTDAGEISIAVSFMYRISNTTLRDMYDAFGQAYHERIVSIAQAELRNGASNFTTIQYQENRTGVSHGLYLALATRIPSTVFVEVSRDRFFLERIQLPQTVLQKKTQVFFNEQLRITQGHNKTAALTRLQTQANVSRLEAQAFFIQRNATGFGNTLRASAAANAYASIQNVSGALISDMKTTLGLTTTNATEALVKFNSLLDTNSSYTLLSGVSGAVLQSAP